jgi:SAM-dependent methyltransferase
MQDAMAVLHQGLTREGPGDDACTQEALARLPALPPHPVVLDLGCGPGRQTLVLARTLNTRVIAVDVHQPYLDQLSQSAADQGLSHLIQTRCVDFAALDVPPRSIDLIWCEGAAYILGFEKSLRRWRPLLSPGGLMAVTECTWLTDKPPTDVKKFWADAYPAMGTAEHNSLRAQAAGFTVRDTFVLPVSAWWADYYQPLLERIESLRPAAAAPLAALIEETNREIDVFRRHSDCYGYVFYLLQS